VTRPLPRRCELVIFDCDGVLVDSERLANAVLAELLTAAGLPTTLEDSVNRYLGRSMPSCVALIEERLGRNLPPDFVPTYYRRIYEAFDRQLQPVPGATEALDALAAAGVGTCVASSGPFDKLRRTLGRTGMLGRFDARIFSATEVERGKPFPDLFLHAAGRLGVAPGRCVVVEDSPAGVEAGVAAGMRVLGYADLVEAGRLAAAGATVFRSLADVPMLILETPAPATGP